ncbi:MAG: replication-associated recombination protein A [Pseudomonadaceae bacterium]|nr:replication-associated recombination protein A [Pseudomonadaceae bacterium]
MTQPLAAKLRPTSLAEVVGQEHLTAEGGVLARLVAAQTPQSLILWGPPGCGKTTLAQIYAQAFGADFVQLSAVLAGVADVRKVVDQAQTVAGLGRKTLLFVDEIHRFNKSQQDAFLPHVESGLLTLVGATTENPSFSLNNALLSRAQVLVLKPLDEAALARVLAHAETEVGGLLLTDDARNVLVQMAHGDARSLLNMVETLAAQPPPDVLSPETLSSYLPKRMANYDKGGDWHYDLISALHKSVRGSDPDAALYYLARMLEGGEDGMYLARRLIRMAVEDIGLADPQALPLAVAAQQAFHTMGSPEGDLALAEVAVYLALAPKSIGVYEGFGQARALAKQTAELAPPKHIVNAPTKLMKELGHGEGYAYDPATADGFSGQNYFPPEMAGRPAFYRPVERGFEREMHKRLAYFAKLRQQKQGKM